MAEFFITGNELSTLSRRLELPVELEYHDHHLVVIGNYRIVVQKQFQLRLAFLKMAGTRIIFEIVESTPSFGMLDAMIKSSLFHWMQKFKTGSSESGELLSIEYLFVTIDIATLPGVDGIFDYLAVEGIDFEETGIRVRFQLQAATQSVSV